MSEQNKQAVRRYFEELDRLRATPVDLCTADYTFRLAGSPPMGLEAVQEFTEAFFRGMPDLQHPLEELIAEGDKSHYAAAIGAPTRENSWVSRPADEPSRRLVSA